MEEMKMEVAQRGMAYEMVKADPAAVAAAESAKQRIQAAYVMAYRAPRSVEQSRVNILEHCKRPGFAEKVEYSKPVGKSRVNGPSIRLIELALREFKNVLIDTQIVYEDDCVRRKKVYVTDMETNTSFNEEIQINKTVERKSRADREVLGQRTNTSGETVYIVKATDDELLIKEAAMTSKAIRNQGRRLLPDDILEEALEIARDTIRNKDARDPDAAKRKILDAFASIGVKPDDLAKYLKHSVDQLVPAEVQDLRGIFQAIKDGESKWTDYIGEAVPSKSPFSNPPPVEGKKPHDAPPAQVQSPELEGDKDVLKAKLAKLLEKAFVSRNTLVQYLRAKEHAPMTIDPLDREDWLKKVVAEFAAYEKKAIEWQESEAAK